ncbi:MAG: Holliday junction branch migration protein RuvA [Pseudomonadota bacterium]
MIGKITGRVDYVAEDHVLVETDAGIGYEIFCATPTLRQMPEAGEWVALYTELVVREDLMQLYGFESRVEREWHRLLVSVQGVGAKVGLGILGALGASGVARALAVGDAPAIRTAPGVGPKLATRIVTELKGKAPDVLALTSSTAGAARPASGPRAAIAASPGSETRAPARRPAQDESALVAKAEAVSALVNLGYDRTEAAAAVAEVGGDGVAEMIRNALQNLGQNL